MIIYEKVSAFPHCPLLESQLCLRRQIPIKPIKEKKGSEIVAHSYSIFQPESYLSKFIYRQVS